MSISIRRIQETFYTTANTTRYVLLFVTDIMMDCLIVGMLRNRLKGRASQVLVGLGRYLRQQGGGDGVVDKILLQQGMRAYHISLTPEVNKVEGNKRGKWFNVQLYSLISANCVFLYYNYSLPLILL